MESDEYWQCTAITKKTGERCKAHALPHYSTCVVHLPADSAMRKAHFADQKRRTQAYWTRWRAAKALAAAADKASV